MNIKLLMRSRKKTMPINLLPKLKKKRRMVLRNLKLREMKKKRRLPKMTRIKMNKEIYFLVIIFPKRFHLKTKERQHSELMKRSLIQELSQKK
jgi:hypothetical protein